jgi:uncharacterized protein (DUF1697 family)
MPHGAWVALLYSVVLAPGRRVAMADLRAMACELGLDAPRTLVATGNLVFRAAGPAAALEARLEAAFSARVGKRVDIIVRDAAAWRRLVAGNPFRAAAEAAPASVHVRVMRAPLSAETAAALLPMRVGDERLAVVDGDLWLHLPHGAAASRLGTAAGAPRAGVGTFRNWNTVRRLGDMLED